MMSWGRHSERIQHKLGLVREGNGRVSTMTCRDLISRLEL